MDSYICKWWRLRQVVKTVNENRLPKDKYVKLSFSSIAKRPLVRVLKITIDTTVIAILVSSQKKNAPLVTYIDFIWVNRRYVKETNLPTEAMYYQVLYDVFIRWYWAMAMKMAANNKYNKPIPEDHTMKIALSINLSNEFQIERLRRILSLYGFQADPVLTIEGADFKAPYRNKETITNVVYTRHI